jgi:activator of HSP90 ATPase
MISNIMSRREFGLRLWSIPVGFGVAGRVAAANAMDEKEPTAAEAEGLSHASASIHQEITFSAPRARVYQALTDGKQFEAVTRLSEAAGTIVGPDAKPTLISAVAGGSFTLFGGYISGRHLQLLKDRQLVQAWRAASWEPGEYSIVKFALADAGGGTKLTFDHRGFPDAEGPHLARGWYANYWDPLTKYLSQA